MDLIWSVWYSSLQSFLLVIISWLAHFAYPSCAAVSSTALLSLMHVPFSPRFPTTLLVLPQFIDMLTPQHLYFVNSVTTQQFKILSQPHTIHECL